MTAKQLVELAQKLFSKRQGLTSLWQQIAEQFYVERASFTVKRYLGEDFAGNLSTSYPLLVRRDLGNSLGAMLRPSGQEWFHNGVSEEEDLDLDSKRWLEYTTRVQRSAMYDRNSLFVRACKEGDHDYAAFGQCALSVRLNRNADSLLYRCWHLRDVAWMENEDGKIGAVFRKWKPTVRDLSRLFGDRNHPSVTQLLSQDPYCEIDCFHMVIEADMYDDKTMMPYWSIYYDVTHSHLVEARPQWNKEYVIPRWQTVSDSQYAYSPATIACLPEGRLLQAMTETLIDAGEKAVTPPMWAQGDVIRGDIDIRAGGVTWVDREYDERMGDPIHLLVNDKSGIPMGIDMQRDSRLMHSEAFYLNKLAMPPSQREMTAYETSQRINEYIRQAMPIFEPIEQDYNGDVCETTFGLLLRGGAFGNPQDMPRQLSGRQQHFRFESPLQDAIERQKAQRWLEAQQIVGNAAAMDASAPAIIKVPFALRDVLMGIRTPATWLRSEAEVQQIDQQQRQDQQNQALLGKLQQGADIAKTVNEARAAVPVQ